MRRRLFKFAVTVSLIVCVGTAVLWVQSYKPLEFSFGPNRWEMTTITINRGVLIFYGPHEVNAPWFFEYGLWRPLVALALLWTSPLLFRKLRTPDGVFMLAILANGLACALGAFLAFPLLIVFDSLAVIYVISIIREATKRRSSVSGLCLHCGYNLTGNVSGICPECGTPVPKEPAEKGPWPA